MGEAAMVGREFAHRQSLESRLTALRIVFVVAFAALAVAFWILQVVQHDKYGPWAERNALRPIPLPAPRGVLFDRDGRVLVENRDSFTIVLMRERAGNLDQAIARLAEAIGWPEEQVREPIQRAIANRAQIFRPITVVEHATLQQVVAVKARSLELPGIDVLQVPARQYPANALAAHVFGYVGEIRQEQIGRSEYEGLDAGALVGQSGVERTYNASLMGEDGRRLVVVNSVGREIQLLGQEDPREGSRMQLTIDLDLQKALEDAFRAYGFNGAGAFLDPRTGEILAMTSLPAYDPNVFASGLDRSTWSQLTTDPLTPLNNRLIQGRYAPGSTFKIVMAMAALGERVITPDFRVHCEGGGVFYGRFFQCLRRHGTVDLRQALEQSCNTYFYTLGEKLHIDKIHDYAKRLGLVGRTGIDLPGEVESFVGSTEANLREYKQPWYPGETISVAIGQGKVSVTPIALATMIATVANGGTLVTPHLVKAIDADGQGWKPMPSPAPRAQVSLRQEDLQAVREGLWMVVNGAGTGGRARIPGRDVAGKTGTAQVVSLAAARAGSAKVDVRDHGFFVFFASRDNPEIAGIVFAEHALHGSAAAPIARHVLETFYAKKDRLPLPAPPMQQKTIPATPDPAVAPAERGAPAAGRGTAGRQ
jgi:penicillin-binding protein 2